MSELTKLEVRIKVNKERLKNVFNNDNNVDLANSIGKLVKDYVEAIEGKDSSFNRFVTDRLELANNSNQYGNEVASFLFARYCEFCLDNKLTIIGRNKFYKLICDLPYVYRKQMSGNKLIFCNLKYKVECEDTDEDDWLL